MKCVWMFVVLGILAISPALTSGDRNHGNGFAGSPIHADACAASSLLFAWQGTLYSVGPDDRPGPVASGFDSPYDLSRSPDCRHYAFIDSGGLWVGVAANAPVHVSLPGKPIGHHYSWAQSGDALAVTVEPSSCATAKPEDQSAGRRVGLADAFVVRLPGTSVKRVTSTCGSSVIGWAGDDSKLLLRQESHRAKCPEDDPICTTEDIMILNLGPNQTRVFRTAEQQNEKGGPIETLVDWDSSKDVLFTRNYQSPIGGMGELVAWDEKSGAVLWAHACRQAEALGKGLMSTLDLTWIESLNSTGSKVVVYDRKGKLVRRLPLLPVNANDIGTSWSRDLKYMAWPDRGRAASINFATTRSASAWAFPLPETFEELSLVWTAEGQLVFAAYSGQAQAGKITFTLFMIDPDRRTGTKIWEGSAGLVKQMDKPWEAAQEWWSRGKPGEPETHRVPPFILAQWDGHP